MVRGNTWALRNQRSSGAAHLTFRYGRVGDVPVVGDWDGDGIDSPGVVRGTTWHLRNHSSAGDAQLSFGFGACGDAPLGSSSARTTPGVPVSMRGGEWVKLPTADRVVALTFDAGANADGVASILSTLKSTGTPANFFATGQWVGAYPALAGQITATHPMGNHTQTHPDLTTLSDAAVRNEVVQAHLATRTTTGVEPRPFFRFPFGARNARTIALTNCLNYGSVRWTVDTLGWQGTSGGQSVTTVVDRVLRNLQPGEIVLLHVGSHPKDGSTLDAAALPRIISEVRARGYRFVNLDAYR